MKKLSDDPAATAHYLVQAFAIAVERRVRADDILSLERSAANAKRVKSRQREERQALRALTTHLKKTIRD